MSRAKWKGKFINTSLLKLKNKQSEITKIWSRNSAIPECLLNKLVLVHNGKIFKKLLITKERLGFKFGEFIFTRTRNKSKKFLKK